MKRFFKWALPAVLVLGVGLAAVPDTAQAGHRTRRHLARIFFGYRYQDPYHFYSPGRRVHVGPHSAPHVGPHFHWSHGYHWGPHWQRHWNLHGAYGHYGGL